MPPYSTDNDQPPTIPLLHGGDEPPISPYIGPVTTEYSELKREHMTTNVTAAGGNYSVLNRDDVSCATFHNTAGEGNYSVLKRGEREVN